MVRRRATHLALTLLWVLTASSALAVGGRDVAEGDRERTVRKAYVELAARVAAGGEEIRFELDNFRTFDATELPTVFWSDLATMPGGDMVDVMPQRPSRGAKSRELLYRAQWRLGDPDYAATPEGSRLSTMTADAVLADVARQRPAMADNVEAITSYDVTVTFHSRTRAYRAAVLWLSSSAGTGATTFFADFVTRGLQSAVREASADRRASPAPWTNKLAAQDQCFLCGFCPDMVCLFNCMMACNGWGDGGGGGGGTGGGSTGGGSTCNGEHTCAEQCEDGSWSSIGCLIGKETASCTCSGQPPRLQATPKCTPC